ESAFANLERSASETVRAIVVAATECELCEEVAAARSLRSIVAEQLTTPGKRCTQQRAGPVVAAERVVHAAECFLERRAHFRLTRQLTVESSRALVDECNRIDGTLPRTRALEQTDHEVGDLPRGLCFPFRSIARRGKPA